MAGQSTVHVVVNTVFRLSTLLFAIMAVFAFFETQAILAGSTSLDDFTVIDDELMVPLILCFPKEFDVSGTSDSVSLNYDLSDGLECTQLDWMINACSASLLFGAIASVAYVIIDVMARRNMGPFNKSAAAGMGIFLFFLLMMTGITAGALVEQNSIWVDREQKYLDKLDSELTAAAYGNLTLIMASAIFAFFAAVFDLVDLLVTGCYRSDDTTNSITTNENKTRPTAFPAQKEVEVVETPKEKKKSFSGMFAKPSPTALETPKKKSFSGMFGKANKDDDDEPAVVSDPQINYGENQDKPGWLN